MPTLTTTITTSGQLGPVLKRLRKDLALSQAQLGQKLGLSQERISVMERYPEKLSVDQLLSLLMVLGARLTVARDEATGPAATPPEWGTW
jgi:HTH-type transcriptional regulator/antitoxin HipB